MKITLRVALSFLLFLYGTQINAQTKINESLSPWYIGVKGGLPFGVSTFTSFGADKTRTGWDIGLYGGYILNSKLSAEAFASFGKVGMSAPDNVTYWLGSDGNRYFAPVNGMSGYNDSDIYSDVSMQKYGLKFNVDLLQLFSQNSDRRWVLHASPLFSAVVTNATIKQIRNDAKVMSGSNNIHFGVGGDLSSDGDNVIKSDFLYSKSAVTPNDPVTANPIHYDDAKKVNVKLNHHFSKLLLTITFNGSLSNVPNISSENPISNIKILGTNLSAKTTISQWNYCTN